MGPIGAILNYAQIFGLFQNITKSSEEPTDGVHLSWAVPPTPPGAPRPAAWNTAVRGEAAEDGTTED